MDETKIRLNKQLFSKLEERFEEMQHREKGGGVC